MAREEMGRRDFLRQGALAGLGVGAAMAAGSGCGMIREQVQAVTGPVRPTFAPLPQDANAAAAATHILNRVAFGPRPGDVARVAKMGPAAYAEEQLADSMGEGPTATWRVNGLDVQQTEQDAPDMLHSLDDNELLNQTQQAALLRAVYSRHQLRETLADFWTNHFNIYALKNDGRILLPTDAERVIRPHVLGTFREMLRASAQSPAMLGYLDNQQNRRGVVNENYARELLELHTLGVKSGYTQRDIQEVARCFTGWTINTGFRRGEFYYDASRHDDGAKFIPFLNMTILPRGGQRDAEDVLHRLAMHPKTARFLVRKLCRNYLGSAPEPVVTKAVNAYLNSGSDIKATLRPILLDALLSPEANKPVLKRPVEMVVSSLRALAADTDGGVNVQRHLAKMGQPLYQWPMPDGFPVKASAWTGSLLPRWNFALALASNSIAGTTVDMDAALNAFHAQGSDDKLLDTLVETVFGRSHEAPELHSVHQAVRAHITRARQNAVPAPTMIAEATGLLLSSPAFQWR